MKKPAKSRAKPPLPDAQALGEHSYIIKLGSNLVANVIAQKLDVTSAGALVFSSPAGETIFAFSPTSYTQVYRTS